MRNNPERDRALPAVVRLCGAAALAATLTACGGNDDASPAAATPTFAQTCSSLVGKTVAAGTIVSVSMLDATASMPQTCSAMGTISTAPTSIIHFRIDLPAPAVYNSKLIHVGGGGYNTGIPTAESNAWQPGIRTRGYAIVGSDSGHTTTDPSSTDASWALNNPAAIANFAYASIPQVLPAAVATVTLAYGAAPAHKYFLGASTGGREALQQVQRYSDNYDGVIALVPAVDYTLIFQKITQVQHAAHANNNAGWMNAAKIALYQNAQLAACDALDGLADGVTYNIKACTFDPVVLRCEGGVDTGDTCLSDAQIATWHDFTTNTSLAVPTANGVTTAFRDGIGEETNPNLGAISSLFGPLPDFTGSVDYLFLTNAIRYFITNDPSTDYWTHDPAAWAPQYQAFSAMANANNPDMTQFAAKGSKLIMMETWSDDLVPAHATADLYHRTVNFMGQSRVDGFMRFYTTAGLPHGLGGAGAGSFDFLTALENWVEKSTAPADSLIASKLDASGNVLLTRPLCRFPTFPQYDGTSPSTAASSFSCTGTVQ